MRNKIFLQLVCFVFSLFQFSSSLAANYFGKGVPCSGQFLQTAKNFDFLTGDIKSQKFLCSKPYVAETTNMGDRIAMTCKNPKNYETLKTYTFSSKNQDNFVEFEVPSSSNPPQIAERYTYYLDGDCKLTSLIFTKFTNGKQETYHLNDPRICASSYSLQNPLNSIEVKTQLIKEAKAFFNTYSGFNPEEVEPILKKLSPLCLQFYNPSDPKKVVNELAVPDTSKRTILPPREGKPAPR